MSRSSARKAVRPPERSDASLVAGNVWIHDRRTSVRLEPEMWSALREISEREDMSIHDLCTAVDDCRMNEESFSSSLRVFLLQYYRKVARGGKKALKAGTDRKKKAQDSWPVLRSAKEQRNRREEQDARR